MQIAIRAYGSATSGFVGDDSTIKAIDRFYDLVDKGVETVDHAFNRGKDLADKHHARRVKREVIDAEASETPLKASKTPASSTAAVTRKPRFYIAESIVAGSTIFVVTDGGNARTECSTREFAEKILRALEASA